MQKQFETGLMWFRRDLRVDDNAALFLGLQSCRRLYCAFVFDTDLLTSLPRADRRVEFIRESLVDLEQALRGVGAGLILGHGAGCETIVALAHELGAQAVFAANDYEPQALARDDKVRDALAARGVAMNTVKDHVLLERRELLTKTASPYTVFTPYKNAWLQRIGATPPRVHDCTPHLGALAAPPDALHTGVPTLAQLGFETTNLGQLPIPTGASGARTLFAEFFERMDDYHRTRDFPATKGPSYLGVHLRFGTVSIRRLVATAMHRSAQGSPGAAVWLGELIWRDFYFQILANFPHAANAAFKPAYDAIRWEQGPTAQALFKAWCEGRTGYPLVDAAMAQINQSGYMHNRLRMVAGSFLVKDLGLDWRWGEAYFAQKLNDFDLAANNGGWQWVASSGCDSQPWFRIFNPISQSEKFDPQGKFIRRYLPQLARLPAPAIHAPWKAGALELQAAGVKLGENYPHPAVAHDLARARTLERYSVVRKPTLASRASD